MSLLTFPNVRLMCCLLASSLLLTVGCGETTVAYTEVKRLDEVITEAELKTFLRIISRLPNQKVPSFPLPLNSPPAWTSNRTLPVLELVSEEKRAIEDRWSVERLAKHLSRNRSLQRSLKAEEMTPEQFVSFTLAIGMGIARNQTPEDTELEPIRERGEIILQKLEQDKRLFSSLSDDGAHHVLQQAAWLPLMDRVERLQQLPPENLILIRNYEERLKPLFSEDWQRNPLAEFVRIINEKGIPFDEIVTSGFDENITWKQEDAIVGHGDSAAPDKSPEPMPEQTASGERLNELTSTGG